LDSDFKGLIKPIKFKIKKRIFIGFN